MGEYWKKVVVGFALGLVVALLPSGGWAGGMGAERTSRASRSDPALSFIPPDFNYLPRPQFRTIHFSGEAEAQNGGLGDGSRFSSYYCSQIDEINSYSTLKGGSRSLDPNSPEFRGRYRFIQIEDRCRTEGCGGEIARDGKCFLIGIPVYATNCYPWVGGGVWDAPVYQENPFPNDESSPRHIHHPGWIGRNNVDDGFGFVFGRYLVERVACANTSDKDTILAAEGTSRLFVQIDRHEGDAAQQLKSDYNGFRTSHNFMDIPYSHRHMANGFACPQVFDAGGYRSNPEFGRNTSISGRDYRLDATWGGHHRDLMKQAADRLARDIASEMYGNMYPNPFGVGEGMSVSEREKSEIVVNAWNILDWAKNNINWGECSGLLCVLHAMQRISGRGPVELHGCQGIFGNNIVQYRHDLNRICVKALVARDCQGQRAKGSHPHYNVTGGYPDGDGRCTPSYGEWRDGGLYERRVQTNAGYELYEEGGEVRAREDGYVPADGYSPFITAQLAHQTCHAYFRKERGTSNMTTWPSHEALWEEGLCVMTEAIVYTNLCKLGYCSHNFKMEKTDFVSELRREASNNPDSGIVNLVRGERFSYPNHCRGYANIFLGPYCASMFGIAETIRHGSAEEARMMAIMKAMAPTAPTPEKMYLNGERGDFYLPESTRGGCLFGFCDIDENPGIEGAVRVNTGAVFSIPSQKKQVKDAKGEDKTAKDKKTAKENSKKDGKKSKKGVKGKSK